MNQISISGLATSKARLGLASAITLSFLTAGAGAVWAVEPNAGTASERVSDGGITPYIIDGTSSGGNRTCGEVGSAYFGNASYYQCFSGRINTPDIGPNAFVDVSLNQNCDQIPAITVTDGKFVAFTAEPDGLGALIVKGSNDANTYVYEPQSTSDSGLTSPVNASGNPADLSNLTVCWNPQGEPPPACLENETAWADGDRYVRRGNWATYTSYADCANGVPLFAGKNMDAGTVQCSAPDQSDVVTITVDLNEGWQFSVLPEPDQDGVFDDNIKVQDYDEQPPDENPSPGLFLWKTVAPGDAGSWEIEVPLNNYYGIHVDVAKEVPCPE
jgi:hypothetical protein